MKRKKSLRAYALLLAGLMVLLSGIGPIYAQESTQISGASVYVSVKNADDDIVNFRGEAPNNTDVLLLVLNPGYSIENIKNDDYVTNTDVIQSVKHVKSVGGEYSCDIQFRPDIGGDFGVVAMYGNTLVNVVNENGNTFEFYPADMKETAIYELNGASDEDDIDLMLDDVLSRMSLYKDKLNVDENRSEISKLIFLGVPYEGSFNDIGVQIKQRMILASLNCGSLDILFDNNKFVYAEDMNIADSDEWDDYANSLSDEGKIAVLNYICKKAYTDVESFTDDFNESVYVNCIMNYGSEGFGHIKEYLEKYHDIYEDAGLDLSAFEKSNKKNNICSTLLDSNVTNMETLVKTFNRLTGKKEETPSSGGGGGGGGKTTSSLETGEGFVKTENDTKPGSGEDSETLNNLPFKDISLHPWAEEAIGYLWNQGIISGRNEDTFAPGDNITRAEFVKMITEAFLTESETYDECSFADVDKSSWYFEYVSKALSMGIVTGISEDAFMPDAKITRQQAAAVIWRALAISDEAASSTDKFSDDSLIDDYASQAIYALKDLGIISGRGDNIFAPVDNITRAEAAKIIYASMKVKE